METIRTEQLVKHYGSAFQLGPVDLHVEAGEILVVMGPQRAGKTSLLKLLWGFTRPDEGSVSVFELQPHLEQVKVRRRAGYLSERPQFYPQLTAVEFLTFVSKFYEGWDETRTNAFLERFGIKPYIPIGAMTKESRAKLGLIAAVGHRPSVLIADEPLYTIDHPARKEIIRFLRKLAKQEGVSVVVSADISDDLDHIADSVLMLNRGSVLEYGEAMSFMLKYPGLQLEEIFANATGLEHR